MGIVKKLVVGSLVVGAASMALGQKRINKAAKIVKKSFKSGVKTLTAKTTAAKKRARRKKVAA